MTTAGLCQKLTELELNNTHMNSYARILEQELISVKQLKSVANLETVLNISSETKHLKNELQLTNNQLQSIANDVNARKQDFIALFNKADMTDKTLDLALKTIETNISSLHWDVENTFNRSYLQLKSSMQVEHDFTRKLEKEIQVRDGRKYAFFASLSADKSNIARGTILVFGTVPLNVGGAYSAANGKFTCKEDGLYFFSWSTLSYPNKDFTSKLVVNGHDIVAVVVDNDLTKDALAGSNSAVVQLRQGESAWIEVLEGAYIEDEWLAAPVSAFTGFLIY
ncbi:heavy metal-binding protein HIP-like [Mytilus edulis]|uniref:heavy metal-binding protein HIP-like n=1 Tax=Mytilus edulis TaxID=6550 RepID=UPI0039EFB0B2